MSGNAELLQKLPREIEAKLSSALAGRKIRIPLAWEVLRRRVVDLTEDEARTVVGIAGDAVVYFRRRDAILARHSRVRVLSSHGTAVPHIAQEVGLSEERVRQILRKGP